ncbi:MAG TPA: ABC transporter ATP-binding protein [Dokdonella sp.]|nr:ABC transporter ATP-binding protein [Dokdonella sp.]
MTEVILRTENLTKRFGGLTAVDDLTLSLPSGRLHAIIGPNGAGKTTFFNLVSGMLPLTSGKVFFRDQEITGLKPHEISRLGIKRTLQIKSVFPQMTVAENLWITRQASQRFLHPFRAASRDTKTRNRVEQTLEEIGMTAFAERTAGTLSYGDVALLEIGMALISEPKLLLLDEPTSALDPIATGKIEQLIAELAEHFTIAIVTHNMQQAARCSDFTAFMYLGELVEFGETEKLFTQPSKQQTEDYITGRFG